MSSNKTKSGGGKGIFLVLLLLALAGGGYYYYTQSASAPTTPGETPAPTSENQQKKKDLVVAMHQFPADMSPTTGGAHLPKTLIWSMVNRPFTVYNDQWELECLLCTELPSYEKGTIVKEKTPDGKDGLAITFTIHPKATWGDGTPVTTKDVEFTLNAGIPKESGFDERDFYDTHYKVTIKDDKTFTLHANRLDCNPTAINAFRLLPAHLEKAAYDKNPKDYGANSSYNKNPTEKGLYFGPYRITDLGSGTHVILEKNPTWYGKAPNFDRVIFKFVENTSALEANLLSGEVDYVLGELGFKIDQALAFEKKHAGEFNFAYKPSMIYEHIDLNTTNPLLSDKRVRQALLYAIDRDTLVKQLFDGKQEVASAYVFPLDVTYNKDVKKYKFDPDKAKKLLDEAGWNVIKDGIRHNANGEKLQLQFGTTAADKNREAVQQILQSQWKDVGVEVVINNLPARVFFADHVKKKDYKHMALFAWVSSPKNVPLSTLHSTQQPSETNQWSGQNYTGFKNARADEILDLLPVTCDPKENKKLHDELQDIYVEELPVLPLFYRADPFITPKWLDGVRPTGHQYPSTYWVEEWKSKE